MPLRFHCIELLVKLGRETDIYIPVLPYIMEVSDLVFIFGFMVINLKFINRIFFRVCLVWI